MATFSWPPISVGAPVGGATSANQVLEIAALDSINTKTPVAGQAAMAASSPVVIASNQSAIPVTLASTTVTGTVAVSAAALPLPAGAATETTLAAMNTKTPALGQAVMASSQPVVLASNQSSIPVTTTFSDITASGTITTQNLVPAGAATAGSAVLSTALTGVSTGLAQVTGGYTGALSLQFTVNGTTWVTAGGTPLLNISTGAFSATIASGVQGIFQFEVAAAAEYRITGLAAMTGTATVSLKSSQATSMVALDAAIPVGANIIGALVANQSVNSAQINGVVPLMGNGVTGTGSLRVTIASDNTAFATRDPINASGSVINTTLTGTTATAHAAPANAVGFLLEAESTNTDNVRWRIGGVASTTAGMLMEPGRDTGYIPCGTGNTVSVCATVSGTNTCSIAWVLSA